MREIKIGCETYTWQMPGQQYKDQLEHIVQVTARAGYTGIEPETSFLGEFADPARMVALTGRYDLELAVLCLVEDWLNPQETEEERRRADHWIKFLSHFPDTLFLLVQMPGADRRGLERRQQNLLQCVNHISRRAAEKGIRCSYHPNSPRGSVFRTEEDYEILLSGLDPETIRYTPDVGHIAKGGMDPLEIITKYRELVDCVHFKDMHQDGSWAPMGTGIIDFREITGFLVETAFSGWIIVEDECDRAIVDPDGVTLEAGNYMEENIRSLIS